MHSAVIPLQEKSAGAVVAGCAPQACPELLQTMRESGWHIHEALGGAEALAELENGHYHVVLLGRWLPDLDVWELAQLVQARHPAVDVYVMDFESKQPLFEPATARYPCTRQLRGLFEREPKSVGGERGPQSASARVLTGVLPSPQPGPLPGMVGTSEQMASVYSLARLLAPRNTTVLLTGETGTGKELVARALHQLSPRRTRDFVIVNCAAIPGPLLEAELFGYVRGAFTGAWQSRLGRCQAAHSGTLFLDEVAELPSSMQAKLLRFLQEGEVQRIGSQDIFKVDVRVIAATNADLLQRVAEGRFRQDLYYRLAVFPIELPPLRERPEDVLPLAEHFLLSLARQTDSPPKTLSAEASSGLRLYSWPGNARELQHMVERAVILAGDEAILRPHHFPRQVRTPKTSEKF